MLQLTDAQVNEWLALFWLPFLRIFGVLLTDPVFSMRVLPVRVRVGLGILLAILIATSLPVAPQAQPIVSPQGILFAVRELLIGVSLGYLMRIIFTGVEMAGHLVGLQMGLGFATLYDPLHSTNTPVLAQFYSLLTLLVFLALDGHLVVLRALLESFVTLPPGTASGSGALKTLAEYGSTIFRSGVMLSLPVLAALLITNLAIGVMTRAAPQLNVFAVGFPLTLGIGLVAMYLSLPYVAPFIDHMLGEFTRAGLLLLKGWGAR
ncbi:flagellar biosynthetic protein FliR [Chitinilyticum piscinae]|uniref:Flagellar biosynthetic protein FliR n=1 Tax=Chitinilyticum piscinae TaxID=2866724 RepID=A0A8J7KB86_9NEIS|nr:flagellar biosynthetic protein FliR [Chitinilyticum piscinae]MBE9609964.1 flagellar biosynthetic protein FliR [Chitinilyticum piscinae]